MSTFLSKPATLAVILLNPSHPALSFFKLNNGFLIGPCLERILTACSFCHSYKSFKEASAKSGIRADPAF